MAVTNNGNRIILAAGGDAVTGRHLIQAIALDHSAAANCVIQDSNSKEIAKLHVTTTMLTCCINFNPPLAVNGFKASTLSAGQVTVYMA